MTTARETWRCSHCGTEKSFTAAHFGRDKNRKYGLKTICRYCERATKRKGGPYYTPQDSKYKLTRATGVPYKDVLPREKWPVVQSFIVDFLHYSRLALQQGVKPDVAAFMAEWGGHTAAGGGHSERSGSL